MRAFLKLAVAATAMAGSLVAVAAPADARPHRWHGYRHHHGDATGAAIIAGIAGVAIGAAIADGGRHRHYDYYDHPRRGYGYYGPRYRHGYYGPPVRYYYARPRCWTRFAWDPYYGRVPVRVCG